MQLYQFERIYSQMEKEFGRMGKGEEDVYSMLFSVGEKRLEDTSGISGFKQPPIEVSHSIGTF